jgi:hypothetical protein
MITSGWGTRISLRSSRHETVTVTTTASPRPGPEPAPAVLSRAGLRSLGPLRSPAVTARRGGVGRALRPVGALARMQAGRAGPADVGLPSLRTSVVGMTVTRRG